MVAKSGTRKQKEGRRREERKDGRGGEGLMVLRRPTWNQKGELGTGRNDQGHRLPSSSLPVLGGHCSPYLRWEQGTPVEMLLCQHHEENSSAWWLRWCKRKFWKVVPPHTPFQSLCSLLSEGSSQMSACLNSFFKKKKKKRQTCPVCSNMRVLKELRKHSRQFWGRMQSNRHYFAS